jgi:ATP-dependent 26S proteasome regulatory subunit
MTTNKIDTLDKALIRLGRIDIMVELKKSTRYDILRMIQLFWKVDITIDMIKKDLDNVYTSAEIINIFRSNNFEEMSILLLEK